MAVNKEHMEQWIAALEAYDREPARGMIIRHDGRMCAMGIGVDAMEPGILSTSKAAEAIPRFFPWLGLEDKSAVLKPDGSGHDHVVLANDQGKQSPWTIAQRLRETYLKDES